MQTKPGDVTGYQDEAALMSLPVPLVAVTSVPISFRLLGVTGPVNLENLRLSACFRFYNEL